MDFSTSSIIKGDMERVVEAVNARVNDQSQGHTYSADNGGKIEIHTGAQININPESLTVKKELPPLPRCPAPCTGYVRRQHLEDHMSSYFFSPSHDGQRRKRYVLHGLGGSGKTQGALTFIDRHFYSLDTEQRRFSEVYWVDATSVETITKSLEDIARSAGAGSGIEDALRFLAGHGPKSNWVMLYNNADDPSLDLPKYFPKCTHGNIIITTRNRHAARCGLGPGSDYALSGMEPSEAEALLLDQARLFNPSPTAIRVVNQLIKELNYFPLSVRQAGAYISATLCTVTEYLDMFQTRREELLREHGNAEEYEYSSVDATLSLSFAKLSREAQQLLQLCSSLHHEHIVDKIWQDGLLGLEDYRSFYEDLFSPGEGIVIASLVKFREKLSPDGHWNIKRFRALVKELQCYSLILYTPEQASCSIHPLVQEWTGTTSYSTPEVSLCQTVAILLASTIKQNSPETRSETVEELSFLRILASHIDQVAQDKESLFNGCSNEFGVVYDITGRWNDDHSVLKKYYEACKTVLGKEHEKTLSSMHNLAETYRSQGDYRKAAEMHSEVLEASRLRLGMDHLDTLKSMSCLAMSYKDLGNYQKAADMHSEVLEVRKVVLGEDHPDTLISMHNLATVFVGLGNYQKAVEMHTKVSEISKVVLGAYHPHTLTSMSWLAYTYQSQGDFWKAIEMHSAVWEIQKMTLGEDHPDTLKSIDNLAFAHQQIKDFNRATGLYSELTKLNQVRFGADHPNTQRSTQSLEVVLEEQRHFTLTPPHATSGNSQPHMVNLDTPSTLSRQPGPKKLSISSKFPTQRNRCITRSVSSATPRTARKRKREPDTLTSSKRICADISVDNIIGYSSVSFESGPSGSRSSRRGWKGK